MGPVAVQGKPLIDGMVNVPPFNREALINALHEDQSGRSTFPEFLVASWKAGVVKYDVDFIGRTCTYYGVGDEKYVETYPEVDV
jgi:uncharacterized protein YbcV (DUF1398 family)